MSLCKQNTMFLYIGGSSCYIDQYTIGADCNGKEVTLLPLEPRGCRFIELHINVEGTVNPMNCASIQLLSATALYVSDCSFARGITKDQELMPRLYIG